MAEQIDNFAGRWEKLNSDRMTHLNRVRQCSALTLPWVVREDGQDINTELITPYQSHGARCVSNLASKLWLTLFPTTNVFFKLDLTPEALIELQQNSNYEVSKANLDAAFAKIENTVMDFFATSGIRTAAFRAMIHYVTTGNVLLYLPPPRKDHHPWRMEGYGLKIFGVDKYVVVRDPMGIMLELLIKENVSIAAIPAEVAQKAMPDHPESSRPENKLPLFTRVWLEDGHYKVAQQVGKYTLPDSEGSYPIGKVPWIPVRWNDEDEYGHGPVEHYLGDFRSLERLSQALTNGALAASRMVGLVNPNGVTMIEDLNQSEDFQFVPGVADDVHFLQMEKYHDFGTAAAQVEKLETRLAFAFLLNSAIQRQGERVTAEEIRYMAQELEDTLGGQYSLASRDIQLPLVSLVMDYLIEMGKIPNLPKEDIKPTITAGMEALGRTHEQVRLGSWVDDLISKFGPEPVAGMLNILEYAKRSSVNFGVNVEGLLPSDEEYAQKQQIAQANRMVEQATPHLAKGLMDYAGNLGAGVAPQG